VLFLVHSKSQLTIVAYLADRAAAAAAAAAAADAGDKGVDCGVALHASYNHLQK